MKFLKLIPILLIFFGNFPYKNLVHAEVKNPKDYKVLSNDNKKLSISNVEYYLTQGDKFIKNGDFDKAKDSYLNARKLAKQLASFYSDLNTSFKGVDARIPKEMQRKGKDSYYFFLNMLHSLIIQVKVSSVNKAEIRKYLIHANVIYSLAY